MPVAFGCLKKFSVWDGSEETYCEVTTEVTLIVAGVRHILNLVDPTFLPKPFKNSSETGFDQSQSNPHRIWNRFKHGCSAQLPSFVLGTDPRFATNPCCSIHGAAVPIHLLCPSLLMHDGCIFHSSGQEWLPALSGGLI